MRIPFHFNEQPQKKKKHSCTALFFFFLALLCVFSLFYLQLQKLDNTYYLYNKTTPMRLKNNKIKMLPTFYESH